MSKRILIPLCVAIMTSFNACRSPEAPASETGIQQEISGLVEEATREVGSQRYDTAMEKALEALDLSRQEGEAIWEVRSLSCIVGIDIMSSRDADAWEKALQAESLARKHGFKKELAEILISKAKLCSYAEISPETGRNDEGLEYAQEVVI